MRKWSGRIPALILTVALVGSAGPENRYELAPKETLTAGADVRQDREEAEEVRTEGMQRLADMAIAAYARAPHSFDVRRGDYMNTVQLRFRRTQHYAGAVRQRRLDMQLGVRPDGQIDADDVVDLHIGQRVRTIDDLDNWQDESVAISHDGVEIIHDNEPANLEDASLTQQAQMATQLALELVGMFSTSELQSEISVSTVDITP